MDDNLYLTTYEAALAVVATAMKKARLRIDVLVINSLMGGMLFTTGGMLYDLIRAGFSGINETNPGVISLLQGICYPIGLFYVVILGVDLFNSNILFFSTALCRGAVSFLDLFISWFVSWWFNLVGNIFVCYIFCYYSDVVRTQLMVVGSVEVAVQKAESTFVETLLKATAGNFYVCLAIFLQLMAKPLHVKFLMMLLPVFTFVAMGFTHLVADMFLVTMGLINGAPISVGKAAWKVFLPGAIGNIIGGSFFGVVITWYLHIYVVERDRAALNLPQYELRDEQPELNQDSRVVRKKSPRMEDEVVHTNKFDDSEESEEIQAPEDFYPTPVYDETSIQLYRLTHRKTRDSISSLRSTRRSPKNVFPVYGMGVPLKRERTIAGEVSTPAEPMDEKLEEEAEYIGTRLRKAISNRSKVLDLEANKSPSNHGSRQPTPRSSFSRRSSNVGISKSSEGPDPTDSNIDLADIRE